MEKREKKEVKLNERVNMHGVISLLMIFFIFVSEVIGTIIGGKIGYSHSIFLMIVGGIAGLLLFGTITCIIFMMIIVLYERKIE